MTTETAPDWEQMRSFDGEGASTQASAPDPASFAATLARFREAHRAAIEGALAGVDLGGVWEAVHTRIAGEDGADAERQRVMRWLDREAEEGPELRDLLNAAPSLGAYADATRDLGDALRASVAGRTAGVPSMWTAVLAAVAPADVLSDEQILLLTRYHDGEMDADEAAGVETWLKGSTAGRTWLESLGELGEACRQWGHPSDDVALWEGVVSRIAPPSPRSGAVADEAAPPAVGADSSWRRWKDRLDEWFGSWTLPVAAAAGAALLLLSFGVRPPRVDPAPDQVSWVPSEPSPWAGQAPGPNQVRIDSIETDNAVVTVLDFESDQPPIIWIEET